VQRARRHGVDIGFWRYFVIGAPLTIVTLAIGVAMMSGR
jgi:Na+/H+ antiporter NhaD/arsenite permease-like protein